MRVQHHFSVTIPLPPSLPPQFLISWLQRYTTTLKHNFSVVTFAEISTLPASIADDPFIGPYDETVRTYYVDEVYALIPGLTARMQWPIIYKSIPDGVRLRVLAINGNIIRSSWIVRPCRNGSSPTDSGIGSSSSSTVTEDAWELYDEGYLEGNRLLMPFSSRYIDMVHDIQSKAIVEAATIDFLSGNSWKVLCLSDDQQNK